MGYKTTQGQSTVNGNTGLGIIQLYIGEFSKKRALPLTRLGRLYGMPWPSNGSMCRNPASWCLKTTAKSLE